MLANKTFYAAVALFASFAMADGLCHSDADCPSGKHCKQQGEFPNIKVCK